MTHTCMWERTWQPSVVINCAAMSNPTECEDNPEMAYAVNVPRFLLHWMSSFGYFKPLLIHLSTDQGHLPSMPLFPFS